MKATVSFYRNSQIVETKEFRTKSEAKKAIEKYTKSVTVHTRVKERICAYIN
jgi:hypothetical protein